MIQGMAGWERSLPYRMAMETGLRWSELYSLTKGSFNFETTLPTVTIKAEDAKNRREDSLPLRQQLAQDMKEHMALLLPTARAFPTMWKDRGASMLRKDLKTTMMAMESLSGFGMFRMLWHASPFFHRRYWRGMWRRRHII